MAHDALYDRIGVGYTATRRTDPRIDEHILAALGDARSVLNVGAGALDCFSRRLVGWSMAEHMRTELVVDALQMAVARPRPGDGLVHHSDRGSPSTPRSRSAAAAARAASRCRWDPRATASTTPSSRASGPR